MPSRALERQQATTTGGVKLTLAHALSVAYHGHSFVYIDYIEHDYSPH